MSLLVAETPRDCEMAGNEISCVIGTSLPPTTANLKIACELFVELNYGSGVFTSFAIQTLVPDANGNCRFFWSRYLRDSFNVQFDKPPYQDVFSFENSHAIRRYRFTAGEFSGTPQQITDALFTGTLNDIRHAFNGAIAESRFAFKSFFGSSGWNNTTLNKAFYDWRGTDPVTTIGADQWLTWMYQDHDSLGNIDVNLRLKWYRSDGTTNTYTAHFRQNVAEFEVFSFPVGFNQLLLSGQETANDKVTKYETWLEVDGSGTVLTEVKTWHVNRDYHEFVAQLSYINSLGVMEQFLFFGAPIHQPKPEHSRVSSYRDSSYDADIGESLVYDTLVENGMAIITGPTSLQNRKQLADLLASKRVFYLTETAGQSYIPVQVKSKVIDRDPLSNAPSYQLEIVQDFKDSVPDLIG